MKDTRKNILEMATNANEAFSLLIFPRDRKYKFYFKCSPYMNNVYTIDLRQLKLP